MTIGGGAGPLARRGLLFSPIPRDGGRDPRRLGGNLTHAGESELFALELEPGADGKVFLRMSVPIAHAYRAAIGRVAAQGPGPRGAPGSLRPSYDREAKTLSGTWRPGTSSRSTTSR